MKKLKNGEEFMVGEKTYRVVDDELFEVKLEKASRDNSLWYPIPYYPIYPIYPDRYSPVDPYWSSGTWISDTTDKISISDNANKFYLSGPTTTTGG